MYLASLAIRRLLLEINRSGRSMCGSSGEKSRGLWPAATARGAVRLQGDA